MTTFIGLCSTSTTRAVDYFHLLSVDVGNRCYSLSGPLFCGCVSELAIRIKTTKNIYLSRPTLCSYLPLLCVYYIIIYLVAKNLSYHAGQFPQSVKSRTITAF